MKVKRKEEHLGMVQVYTGDGKGKTTAALGLALRALGQGKKVLLIQFMKQGRDLGEVKAARRFAQLKVLQVGRKGWVRSDRVTAKDKQLAQRGLKALHQSIASKQYDLIILDELNVAVAFDLVSAAEVVQILQSRPKNLEIVITGRDAHPQILDSADLISEIKELKHYYRQGVVARIGIEY